MSIRYTIVGWLIFTPTYFLLSLLSLQVRDSWSLSPVVWLPAGLLQGVLCMLAPRHWLLWLLTSTAAYLIASQWYNQPVMLSLIFVSLSVVCLAAIALCWQFKYGYYAAPKRCKDILILMAVCGSGGLGARLLLPYVLCQFDYPVDLDISISLTLSYVLSYLPLTFFVCYLLTDNRERIRYSPRLAGGLLAAILIMLLLFICPLSIHSGGIEWQRISVYLSFSLPMLLALSGNLLAVASFLSVCMVAGIGVTLLDIGVFADADADQDTSIQFVVWYVAAFSFPALLVGGVVATSMTQLSHWKKKQQLLASTLSDTQWAYFRLGQDGGSLVWQNDALWQQRGMTPVSWPLFSAWIHPADRQRLDQAKQSVTQSPLVQSVRIADGKGGYRCVTVSMVLQDDGRGGVIEGTIHERIGVC